MRLAPALLATTLLGLAPALRQGEAPFGIRGAGLHPGGAGGQQQGRAGKPPNAHRRCASSCGRVLPREVGTACAAASATTPDPSRQSVLWHPPPGA